MELYVEHSILERSTCTYNPGCIKEGDEGISWREREE